MCRAGYNIKTIGFDWEILSERTDGSTVIHTYSFSVVVQNSGCCMSDWLTVKFVDPGYGGNVFLDFFTTPDGNISYFYLLPGESKTLYAQPWPTSLPGPIPINVTYGPLNTKVQANQYNSGYTLYSMGTAVDTTTSTPGFEVVFIVFALFLVVYLKRKKIKQ